MADKKKGYVICAKTPDWLINFLEKPEDYGAVVTGSVAFGLSGESSDYDYFMLQSDFIQMLVGHDDSYSYGSDCYVNGDYDDSEFRLARFTDKEKSWDFMLVSPEEFKVWMFATKVFNTLLADGRWFAQVVKDKKRRVAIFGCLREQKRAQLKENT